MIPCVSCLMLNYAVGGVRKKVNRTTFPLQHRFAVVISGRHAKGTTTRSSEVINYRGLTAAISSPGESQIDHCQNVPNSTAKSDKSFLLLISITGSWKCCRVHIVTGLTIMHPTFYEHINYVFRCWEHSDLNEFSSHASHLTHRYIPSIFD